MKIKSKFWLLISLLVLAVSCTKTEGEGGTSSITGKVYVINYNADFSQILNEYYAPDEDVFIVYGDDKVYNDKFSTHYDGTYRFRYLRKGTYTIYAYSEDSTGQIVSGGVPVKKVIEITDNHQDVEVEDIVILK